MVRCTDGKKKISTRVYAAKAEKFAAEFTLVQKASMDGLKGKEKKKKGEKKTTKKPSANAAANATAGGAGAGAGNKKKGKKK